MTSFRLHHIGYLVKVLPSAQCHWAEAYGYALDGPEIHDQGQQARVCLLAHPNVEHWIELITPDSPESHLQRALDRHVSLHHVAYAVDHFESAIAALRSAGCVPLGKPAVGAAFQREIMWFHDPQRGLVELIAPGAGPYQLP